MMKVILVDKKYFDFMVYLSRNNTRFHIKLQSFLNRIRRTINKTYTCSYITYQENELENFVMFGIFMTDDFDMNDATEIRELFDCIKTTN